jgi:hypothetical protein
MNDPALTPSGGGCGRGHRLPVSLAAVARIALPPLPDPVPLVTRGAGGAIAAVIAGVSRLRATDKPMHPLGTVRVARLRRHGGAGTGAAFLDEAGEDDVLVRFSRSLGLPPPWPDVNGLAIRVPDGDDEHADLLLSTTGAGPTSRFLLLPTRQASGPFLSTLVPYGSPTGSVLLGARSLSDDTWELAWARPRSAWSPFGILEVSSEPGRDLDLSFDATRAGPSGLEVPDWHRRLRAPSYRAARRARGRRD